MKKLRILITGGSGQLGQTLYDVLSAQGYDVCSLGRNVLDVTDINRMRDLFLHIHPDAVIHCAAYTDVDGAESNTDTAFNVNAFGTRNVAVLAEQMKIKLLYISTDYVFDGEATIPYTEFDAPAPVNVYGKSKLAGEEFVRMLHSRFFIIRTSWLYGIHGRNFVKTMLHLGTTLPQVRVVNDQTGSPTYAYDVAIAISRLLPTNRYGIYHMSNSGWCTWYEFAASIFAFTNITVDLIAIRSDEFPLPAPRPAYSVMDDMSLRLNGFSEMRHWKVALADCLERREDGSHPNR